MTEILCRWLNQEVKLSRQLVPENFAAEFASGSLIGELLNKHNLQNDFEQFSASRTAEAKLNNFTRLEPVLKLLEIPFDVNRARDLMMERHSAAQNLCYELYVALNRKKKSNLTGVAMETMRPAAPAKLDAINSELYKDRLKTTTPRQLQQDMERATEKFRRAQSDIERGALADRYEEQTRYQKALQEQRTELMNKFRQQQSQTSATLARIRASGEQVCKPPSHKTADAIINERRLALREQQAQATIREIAMFEEAIKRSQPAAVQSDMKEMPVGLSTSLPSLPNDSLRPSIVSFQPHNYSDVVQPRGRDSYVTKIKDKSNNDALARKEREKRRRKVLIEQLQAHEAQEELRRDELLVTQVMRQSVEERRIVVQLLQVRHEKDVIRRNRLIREKQIEEQRTKELEEALNKERELLLLSCTEHEDEDRIARERHAELLAEKERIRYCKRVKICEDVVNDLIEFSVNISDYRQLTNSLLPAKLMRDWTELFVTGQRLYEVPPTGAEEEDKGEGLEVIAALDEAQLVLCAADFNEYKTMTGDWSPPSAEAQINGPPRNNPVVGHVLNRLFELIYPPKVFKSDADFSSNPIKGCSLGKPFSGKSTCCKQLLNYIADLEMFDVDGLLREALEAFNNKELDPNYDTHCDDKQADVGQTDQQIEEDQQQKPNNPREKTLAACKQQPSDIPVSETTSVDKKSSLPVVAADNKMDGGEEKSDREKPVEGEEEEEGERSDEVVEQEMVETKKPEGFHPHATQRALLGERATACLRSGQPVSDKLLVEIILERIKRLPECTSWLLDGFPTNEAQAKELERAMTGYTDDLTPQAAITRPMNHTTQLVDVKEGAGKQSVTDREKSSHESSIHRPYSIAQSKLVSNPRPGPPLSPPISGLDLVILFDAPDEVCLQRCTEQQQQSIQQQPQQKTDKNKEDTSTENVEQELSKDGGTRVVGRVDEEGNRRARVIDRIMRFNDDWPQLEKWFSLFKGSLVTRVDASADIKCLTTEVEQVFEKTLLRVQGGGEEALAPAVVPVEVIEVKPDDASLIQQPESVPSEATASLLPVPSVAISVDRAPSKAEVKRDVKDAPGAKKAIAKKGGKDKNAVEKIDEGPPPPAPGSDEWVFVNRPLDMELVALLVESWQTVECTYIESCQCIFHMMRLDRDQIIRYFYQIRVDFKQYLERPDYKQQFLAEWQKDFNSVDDNLRLDADVKADLHQRVDDVKERLWSICDERKEQSERERTCVMNNGWLDDRLGLFTNHYISLMQIELDRYQDTAHIMKDYYRSMEGRIPDPLSIDYARLSLIELMSVDKSCPDTSRSDGVTGDGGTPRSRVASRTDSDHSSGVGSARRKKQNSTLGGITDEMNKRKVPLVARRPAQQQMEQSKQPRPSGKITKTSQTGLGGLMGGEAETTSQLGDLEEKLVSEAYAHALESINKLLSAETAARDAEDATKLAAAATAAKLAAAEAKKQAKLGVPKPAKTKSGESDPEPVEELSEEVKEEQARELDKEKGRKEYFAAIEEEAAAAKLRLDLIRAVAVSVLGDLKNKAEAAYTDMNDWLGREFLQEMHSIDEMCAVMRNAIETGTQIKEELVLEHGKFVVNMDIRLIQTPSPPPPPEPPQVISQDTLTIPQLRNLCMQFSLSAPNGFLSVRNFQEILQNLAALSEGSPPLPVAWTNLSDEKLLQIGHQLSADGYFLDWRSFLLQASQPWPPANQNDLLNALKAYQEIDQKLTGLVSLEQHRDVETWLKRCAQNRCQPGLTVDRMSQLIDVFFEIMTAGTPTTTSSMLDYVKLLLYFSESSDALFGLSRALSVVCRTCIPRLRLKAASETQLPEPQTLIEVCAVDDEYSCEEMLPVDSSNDSATVPLEALQIVLSHGARDTDETNRFATATPTTTTTLRVDDQYPSQDCLVGVYQELGGGLIQPQPITALITHPVMQDILTSCKTFRTFDVRQFVIDQMCTESSRQCDSNRGQTGSIDPSTGNSLE